MSRTRASWLVGVASVLILASGCSTPRKTEPAPTGVTWQLVAPAGDKSAQPRGQASSTAEALEQIRATSENAARTEGPK